MCAHCLVEARRPVIRFGVPGPLYPPQVVHHVAAADDQHAFVAQRREARAEFVVVARRLAGIEAQLHDRHVRLREHMREHRPGAVVQPPALVLLYIDWCNQLAHARREVRAAGCRVLKLKQLLREAAEVVNGARPVHRGDGRAARHPVGGHREDRLRFRQYFAEPPPGVGVAVVLECVHRAAVAEEHGRHACRSGGHQKSILPMRPDW